MFHPYFTLWPVIFLKEKQNVSTFCKNIYVNPQFVMFKIHNFPDKSFSYSLSLSPPSMSIYFCALLPLILLLLKHLFNASEHFSGNNLLSQLKSQSFLKSQFKYCSPNLCLLLCNSTVFYAYLIIFYALFSQLYLPLGHNFIKEGDNVMLFHIIVHYQKL